MIGLNAGHFEDTSAFFMHEYETSNGQKEKKTAEHYDSNLPRGKRNANTIV